MTARSTRLLLALCAAAFASACAASTPPRASSSDHARCGRSGVAVQVLGSGGPIADDERASAGYVVWVDGEPRLLVDLGGGTLQRLGAAGVDAAEVHAVVVTHLHADHSADLAAFLKSATFSSRTSPLEIFGPTGNERFPAIGDFVGRLVGDAGAYPYLSGLLDDGDPFEVNTREVDVARREPTTVLSARGLTVRAVGVPHGPVPTIGVAVEAGEAKIAFTSDQRMDEERFTTLARGADLLVAHHAIPERASATMRSLHATPSAIGDLAARASAGRLLLSHHMSRSLEALDASVSLIAERFEGPVTVAEDLGCYAVVP